MPDEVVLRLRALMGTWEGDPIVAGVSHEYEHLDGETWDALLNRWKNDAPAGTSNWREIWLDVHFDQCLFSTPELRANAVNN